MAVEFFVEASVLVGVLGILDFVITWRQQPTLKVVAWSLGIAVGLFSAAVIMQAVNEPEPEEASSTFPASNRQEEETANA